MNDTCLKKQLVIMIHWYTFFACSIFNDALSDTISSNLCDNTCDNPCDRTPVISVDREDATDSSVEIFSLIQPKRE